MAEEGRDERAAGGGRDQNAVASSSSDQRRVRPAPSDGKEARDEGSKRPRRADIDMASRGRRMFGLLNSTLSKAKEDNAKRNTGEAARKRAEIEARMQEKMKAEEETIKQRTDLLERLRSQLNVAYTIALDIHSNDAMIRVRKAQKRRLASFMITPSKYSEMDGEAARKIATDGRVIAPDVASCLAPMQTRSAPDPPVYFLPKQMLQKQDDILDDQEDRVDDAIDEADKAWEKQREVMQGNLDRIKGIIRDIRVELIQLEHGERRPKESSTQEGDE